MEGRVFGRDVNKKWMRPEGKETWDLGCEREWREKVEILVRCEMGGSVLHSL